MYHDRLKLYETLEKMRGSTVLLYVTSTRGECETQIHQEVVDFFVEHLDSVYERQGRCEKISLILHSHGGSILAGWSIVNLLRMYCRQLEVIIPSKALSTATLISIGADNIVMTKQACLGPIDPSINGPYNPSSQYGQLPVSVEHLFSYLDLAKKYGKDTDLINNAFVALVDKVHPLALGNAAKSQTQIRMLAEKLLRKSTSLKPTEREKIINFLCSDSGSHDYTINRDEARELKLPIETPSKEFYDIIREIYNDFKSEMKLAEPFKAENELGKDNAVTFRLVRALIESVNFGHHSFLTHGNIERVFGENTGVPSPIPSQNSIKVEIAKEGWEYELPKQA